MLMSDPAVMLLDEPSCRASSLVAVDTSWRRRRDRAWRRRGFLALLLVEQRIDVATRVCDRLYVRSHGGDRRGDDA